jgi:hypothetical protein
MTPTAAQPITRPRSDEERSGRLALLTGLGALLIGAVFGYLHRSVLFNWPAVAVDQPGAMFAYFVAGTVFQVGVPILCLVAVHTGRYALARWTARIGLVCAATAFAGYVLYVRTCFEIAL